MSSRPEPDAPLAAPTLDAGAFDARFRVPLMRYFLRRVATRVEAEDLTQEVFVRLLRRDTGLRQPTADAFVFQIATNLLRDRARRARSHCADRHLSLDEGTPGWICDCAGADPDAERVLVAQEELHAALAALDELGERCRDIFLLFRVERMKQKEIARLYGLSVRMVEKYIVKAAAHLARRLGRP